MVLFLLVIGILLVAFNFKAFNKEKSSFNKVFHTTEEDMREFEVRLGEIRREFSETILELQKEIQELKKLKSYEVLDDEPKENEIIYEEINEKMNESKNESRLEATVSLKEKMDIVKAEEVKTKNKVESEHRIEKSARDNSVKIEEINKLLVKGLSVEEVSIKLGIGKGEVLLIKDLYLK